MNPLEVCAAVIVRNSKLLLTTRPSGTHLEGKWELPGGKIHPRENHTGCIRREIAEELGLRILSATDITTILHHYPRKSVRLHIMRCSVDSDTAPLCRDGQSHGWFSLKKTLELDLADADRKFLETLTAEKLSAL